jgi:nucleoside-diphosphate-sugar epimerase
MSKILVIGADGQIGVGLTRVLRELHGEDVVIGAEVRLDVLDKVALHSLVIREKVKVIYFLTDVSEKHLLRAWDQQMFWQSSVAVFGGHSAKAFCQQHSVTMPVTGFGIGLVAGELWCRYYHEQYGVDVRSIRFPVLIGGAENIFYANVFQEALRHRSFTSCLKSHTALPVMYVADAVRAIINLMAAPAEKLSVRTAYNVQAMSFTPGELGEEIGKHLPSFKMTYKPDHRQVIAESWPVSVDDRFARHEWGWKPEFDLLAMVKDMLKRSRAGS